MAKLDIFKTFPVGSVLLRPEAEAEEYLIEVKKLPTALKSLVTSAKTAAYLRGLAKQYNLPLQTAQRLAFGVLRIATGKLPLANLSVLLSGELKLANDKAQQIAAEIERDLFAPVMLELRQHLVKQAGAVKEQKADAAQSAGARNVLNLDDAAETGKRPASSQNTSNPATPGQSHKSRRSVLPLPPRRRLTEN